jgi:hypothetical protein
MINSQFTPNQKKEIHHLIVSTLENYDKLMRIKSGNIQSGNFVSGSSGWQLDSSGNLEANDGTFRGTININSSDGTVLELFSGTQATAYFFANNSTYSPADTLVGFLQALGSGTNYKMILYGHEGTIIQRAFFDGLEWQIVNVATFDSNGIALSGPSGNFISGDGSAGITQSQQFKDGAGTTRTMTIKNGIITAIA